MKKNLLKQSVIAVLVGGALSASAFAQVINTDDSSDVTLKKGQLNSIVASIAANTQTLSGFEKDQDIYTFNSAGKLEKRKATEADVNSDPLEGKGVVESILENQADIDANTDAINLLSTATTSSVTNLGDDIKKLKEYAEEIDQDVANLKGTVYDNRGLVDTVDSHTDAIADLKSRNDYRTLAEIQTLVASKAEQNDLVELESDVENLENRADGLEDELNRTQDDVVALESDVEALENRADGLEDDVYRKFDVLDATLDTHKGSIATNKTAIDANKTAIDANKTAIDANKADITAHTATIATHTQRLDNLDNRVNNLNKDLKRGLAAQAALNGLFQPYNVGKLNLTAAVGGYKSQTAVAVGTGYRYNENIATKAGVAFTRGGSATYNVGVNFEW
ncbi:Adhesin YadA precursor [Haemophilus influenzae]|uniref:YadA C-terminal domain-containing protein n=1 Tax=Haemophilus influenzae TaxID=727 RepID=UPI000D3F1FDC|nr:YadA C-terminal domain-containing protein [Haemophilus influenzae]PRM16905.1 Adhesin YadA precursor [Haemophilus influenzae]